MQTNGVRYARLVLSWAALAQCLAAGADDRAAPTFVWNAQMQALFDSADPERGRQIAESKCNRCHGDAGITAPEDQDVPNLAGQHAVYLFKQGKDYQAEMRETGVCSGVSASSVTRRWPTWRRGTPRRLRLATRGQAANRRL